MVQFYKTPLLSGVVCAYHFAVLGSSPKHTIYAFIIYSICAIGICHVKSTKINKKRPGLAHLFKKRLINANVVFCFLFQSSIRQSTSSFIAAWAPNSGKKAASSWRRSGDLSFNAPRNGMGIQTEDSLSYQWPLCTLTDLQYVILLYLNHLSALSNFHCVIQTFPFIDE